MTVTTELPESPVETVEFQQLNTSNKGNLIDTLVKDYGIVYVTSITRDRCSGCTEQKPLFRELAGKMNAKHPGHVRFTNVHIRYEPDDQKESWEAKKVFGHVAYPTYIVHVKSHLRPLEAYRAVYPTMEELEKQAAEAMELAEYYETEKPAEASSRGHS